MSSIGKVLFGLIIFLALLSFPFVYNMGKDIKVPIPELTDKAKEAKHCVESKEYMRGNHMQLLDDWRDAVVRDGKKIYVAKNKKRYKMSLQNTCLECHSNKKQFCDRCHGYMDVKPYCWDCHLDK